MKFLALTSIFTARQRSCEKLMYSDVSLHQAVLSMEVLMWQYPSCIELRCIWPFQTLVPQTSDMGAPALSSPHASDIWWPSLQTCSNLFTWGPPSPVQTSGDHQSMYGCSACGTHPTRILSCFSYFLQCRGDHHFPGQPPRFATVKQRRKSTRVIVETLLMDLLVRTQFKSIINSNGIIWKQYRVIGKVL